MDCSTADFPVLLYLQKIAQTHIHCVDDAFQSSHLVTPFSCPQSFPASGSFQMSQLLTLGDQSIGASASVSVFLMNTQDWFPLELTGLILLLSKKLSKVFCSTTIRKVQFFSSQPSLVSNSRIHTWLLENHSFYSMDLCWQSNLSVF